MSSATTVVETSLGKFCLSANDHWIGSGLFVNGSHQGNDLALMMSLIAPGSRVLDLGAHVGTIAIPIARHVGKKGYVKCVEASERTSALLRQNISLNGLQNVEVVQAVVATTAGSFRPSEDVDQMMHSGALEWVPVAEGSAVAGEQVESVTVDQLLASMKYDVDYIKCDIEGYDTAIIASLDFAKFKKPPALSFECSSFKKSAPAIANLEAAGYTLLVNIGPRNAGVLGPVPIKVSDLPQGVRVGLVDVFSLPPRMDASAILGKVSDLTRQMALAYKGKQFEKVLQLFSEASAPSPSELAFCAEANRMLGRRLEAIEAFRRLVAVAPSTFAFDALAGELIGEGRLAEAAEAVGEARRLGGSRLGCQVTLANLKAAEGDADGAAALLESIIEKTPDYTRAVSSFIAIKIGSGALQAASEAADRLLALDPENANGHVLAARVAIKQKQFKKALAHLQSALDLEPGKAGALRLLENLQRRGKAPAATTS